MSRTKKIVFGVMALAGAMGMFGLHAGKKDGGQLFLKAPPLDIQRSRSPSPTHGVVKLEPLAKEILRYQTQLAVVQAPGSNDEMKKLIPGLRRDLAELNEKYEEALSQSLDGLGPWGQTVTSKERVDRVRYLGLMIQWVGDEQKSAGFIGIIDQAKALWRFAKSPRSPRPCAVEEKLLTPRFDRSDSLDMVLSDDSY